MLRDGELVVRWIAELTGQHEATVQRRLRAEYETPGANVGEALAGAGIEPFVWSGALRGFYGDTDAFLYELVLWNLNELKAEMCAAVLRILRDAGDGALDVLTVGGGIGIDSAAMARAGHRVTYVELPGCTRRFAERVFEVEGVAVRVAGGLEDLVAETFDAVVCLDVLEHVPDPEAMVASMARRLRPGGRLIVHAPFAMVHPSNPTHLRSNRRFSGSLSLYRRRGLALIDGAVGWNPIAFGRSANGTDPPPRSRIRIAVLWLSGLVLMLGRVSVHPFFWAEGYRRRRQRWFD